MLYTGEVKQAGNLDIHHSVGLSLEPRLEIRTKSTSLSYEDDIADLYGLSWGSRVHGSRSKAMITSA